jgi:FtsZ-binding cell division protein ZapB
MMSDREVKDTSNLSPPTAADVTLPMLQAECEGLRQQLHQLEQEYQHERQARLAVQAERDSYHRSLAALLRERAAQTDSSTDEDLDRLAPTNYFKAVPLWLIRNSWQKPVRLLAWPA